MPAMPAPSDDDSSGQEAQRRALRAMGVTMVGVVISVATTVGFGLTGPWWIRLGVALLVTGVLVVAIKLGTTQGSRGSVAKAADWMTGG